MVQNLGFGVKYIWIRIPFYALTSLDFGLQFAHMRSSSQTYLLRVGCEI